MRQRHNSILEVRQTRTAVDMRAQSAREDGFFVMRYVGRLLMALILAVPLGAAGPAKADFGPLEMIGGAAALKAPHQTIRMHSMAVAIRLGKTSYTVDAVFHFFNSGETTAEWVGFPKRGNAGDFSRFETWVDGRKAGVSEERKGVTATNSQQNASEDPDRWLVQRVAFPGHALTTIRMSYEASYRHDRRGPRAGYEYGTGAFWKDSIGSATITIDGTDIGGTNHFSVDSMGKWRRLITQNAERFEVSNYEPNHLERLTVYLKP